MSAFLPPPFPTTRRHTPRRPRIAQTPVCSSPSQKLAAAILTTTILSTPVLAAPNLLLDYDHILTTGQTTRLESRLRSLEDGGTKVRVLTQNLERTPGQAVKSLLGLGDDTALIVIDRRSGNVLNFNIGAKVKERIPLSFWNELGNRYGNEFYVRENGPDQSLFESLDKIEECSKPNTFCQVVPGISDDQLYVSIASAAVAGCVAGAASRTGGKRFNLPYLLLFSPLWSIFLISFGIGPVVTRVHGWSWELASVVVPFLFLAAGVWLWIPARFGEPGQKDPSE